MANSQQKAEVAASIAEILTALARMARERKLSQLNMMLETAIKQAEFDATNESKKQSRKRSAA
jgi:hypothetical protein